MNENLLAHLPEISAKMPLAKLTNTPFFWASPEGEKFAAHAKIYRWILLVIGGLLIGGLWAMVFVNAAIEGWWAAMVLYLTLLPFFLIPVLLIAWYIHRKRRAAILPKIAEHCFALAQELGNKYFANCTGLCCGNTALIYNQTGCCFINSENGDTVFYRKSDIKEVTLKRVRISVIFARCANIGEYVFDRAIESVLSGDVGSGDVEIAGRANIGGYVFTSGNSFTTTEIKTATKKKDEWHFNIRSGLREYPKISLVMPDSKFVENEIGKAYAVLKPKNVSF